MRADRRRRWLSLLGLLGLSSALHVAAYVSIPGIESLAVAPSPAQSEFVEIDPPAPEPAPEPQAEPEPEPEPVRPAPQPRPVAANEPPPPRDAPPPPPAREDIADFSGEVLTAEGGGFAVQQANGQDREGPIGRPGALVTGRNVDGEPGGAPGGTGTGPVRMEDLSRQPSPPSQATLNQLLLRHYPPEARAQGIEGRARVRIVLGADGHPVSVRAIGDGTPAGFGFGAACQRAIQQSPPWEPGLDAAGRPVRTPAFTFGCVFDVSR